MSGLAPETPTILLVHGAWHGSWCWEQLLPLLAGRGLETRAVDLPSCGSGIDPLGDLHDDAEAVRAAVRAIRGPVVLCGHSWGGVVVTEAAAGEEAVRRLVFLSAYVPDTGESVATLRGDRPPRPWILARDSVLEVDLGAARDILYHDCDLVTAAWAAARLRPQNVACVVQEVSEAAWRTIPVTYAVTGADRVLEPELQRQMAGRAARDVVELPTGHSSFLARPELVADLLARVD